MKKIISIIFSLIITLSINLGFSSLCQYVGNFYFSPSSLTINSGDTVTWINVGGVHDVNGNISTITGISFNNPESFNLPVTLRVHMYLQCLVVIHMTVQLVVIR